MLCSCSCAAAGLGKAVLDPSLPADLQESDGREPADALKAKIQLDAFARVKNLKFEKFIPATAVEAFALQDALSAFALDWNQFLPQDLFDR